MRSTADDRNHLTYCLNIHPGETLAALRRSIEDHALAVRDRFAPGRRFPLGLRLSAAAAEELQPQSAAFRAWLDGHGLYVVSLNAFPYGTFHGRRVKEDVYLPDWTDPARLAYTRRCAEILAALLPEGEDGSISTVPCGYRDTTADACLPLLSSAAAMLEELEENSGRHILLALEPEPDCLLGDLSSTLQFFRSLFRQAPECARRIGVCLDTCHAAVEFESPLAWLEALRAAGITVPKVQLSSALRVAAGQDAARLLAPFAEEQYLHQTRVRSNNGLLRFPDLPAALAAGASGEWRVHFHVPLDWQGGAVGSTASLIEPAFFAALGPGTHVEVETYSFNVLPGPRPALVDSIVGELQWAREKLRFDRGSGFSIY